MSVEEKKTTARNKVATSGRISDFFGLERNTLVVSIAVFLIGTGEELWKKFLPKYLEALGASVGIIGFFGTVKDFLDAVYQYPGGWLADRFGRRHAFFLFLGLASIGYLIYLFSPSWQFVFVGLALTMAWQSMASPAIFAVIGDALPKERRTIGFTLQSILKRVPVIFAPVLGGILIASVGVKDGVRVGLLILLLLVAVTAFAVQSINLPIVVGENINIKGVWQSFHYALKRLLFSDIIIRNCEGMAEIFIVLYVSNILGISLKQYGLLVAVQVLTSIMVYFPAAKLADRIGRKPFVIATFVCFAVYPIAVAFSTGVLSLIFAFIIGGLREIGEPSRKAMIVDFAGPHLRGRTVGLYYLVRGISITPAALIGGFLWQISPSIPFLVAGLIGLIGTIVFALTVEERFAS